VCENTERMVLLYQGSKWFGMELKYPLTLDEFIYLHNHGQQWDYVLIDNAEMFSESFLTREIFIDTITLTEVLNEKENKNDNDK